MKTDQLIGVLAAGVEPVDPQRSRRVLMAASAIGIVAALPLMMIGLGINPALAADATQPMFWVKAAFVAAIAVLGARLVPRLALPGRRPGLAAWGLAVPLAALWALAAAVLAAAPADARAELVLGSSWTVCAVSITVLSLPALGALLWVVRGLAPTRPVHAGAAVGLLAGALGALVYLLHCPELAAPFLAIWYVLGMLIPVAIGAALGSRVLRW